MHVYYLRLTEQYYQLAFNIFQWNWQDPNEYGDPVGWKQACRRQEDQAEHDAMPVLDINI